MDVQSAFLHGTIDDDLPQSWDLPQGCKVPESQQHLVCKLKKTLCGLKQSHKVRARHVCTLQFSADSQNIADANPWHEIIKE